MPPSGDREKNYKSNKDEVMLVEENESPKNDSEVFIIGPLAGSDVFDYVRSKNFMVKNNIRSYKGIKYFFQGISVLLLLIIGYILIITMMSVYTLKKLKIKKKGTINNYMEGHEDKEYKQMENELINLRKRCNGMNDKLLFEKKKHSISRSIENPHNIIEMDENKMAEVFHMLAKKSQKQEEYFIPKETKGKDVIMIGEDESICIVNKNTNKNKLKQEEKLGY
uniref:RIC3 domain-containing protein n=1 Tax=Strongyloides stercoralis TaxID=6248 RepID=A0A0K0ET60_STRER